MSRSKEGSVLRLPSISTLEASVAERDRSSDGGKRGFESILDRYGKPDSLSQRLDNSYASLSRIDTHQSLFKKDDLKGLNINIGSSSLSGQNSKGEPKSN